MDDYAFVNMLAFGKGFTQDKIFVEEYKVYLERSLRMIGVTADHLHHEKCHKRGGTAAGGAPHQDHGGQMADKLADEQLRIVHQIAELLGETAADTKVAVEKLKETIRHRTGKVRD